MLLTCIRSPFRIPTTIRGACARAEPVRAAGGRGLQRVCGRGAKQHLQQHELGAFVRAAEAARRSAGAG